MTTGAGVVTGGATGDGVVGAGAVAGEPAAGVPLGEATTEPPDGVPDVGWTPAAAPGVLPAGTEVPACPVPPAAVDPAPDGVDPAAVGDTGVPPGRVADDVPDVPSSCWVVESMDALSWAMVCRSAAICLSVCSPDPVLKLADAGGVVRTAQVSVRPVTPTVAAAATAEDTDFRRRFAGRGPFGCSVTATTASPVTRPRGGRRRRVCDSRRGRGRGWLGRGRGYWRRRRRSRIPIVRRRCRRDRRGGRRGGLGPGCDRTRYRNRDRRNRGRHRGRLGDGLGRQCQGDRRGTSGRLELRLQRDLLLTERDDLLIQPQSLGGARLLLRHRRRRRGTGGGHHAEGYSSGGSHTDQPASSPPMPLAHGSPPSVHGQTLPGLHGDGRT